MKKLKKLFSILSLAGILLVGICAGSTSASNCQDTYAEFSGKDGGGPNKYNDREKTDSTSAYFQYSNYYGAPQPFSIEVVSGKYTIIYPRIMIPYNPTGTQTKYIQNYAFENGIRWVNLYMTSRVHGNWGVGGPWSPDLC